MQDVMVDLETLGTAPGCIILSIGAVAFDEFSVSEKGLYVPIRTRSCEDAGLHRSEQTENWWKKQSPEARKIFDQCAEGGFSLELALAQFADFLGNHSHPRYGTRLWGNGADFDNPILAAAFHAIGVENPVKFGGRCYRTVKNQFPDIKMKRVGTYHNALDDARSQAQHLVEICKNRGWKLA